MPNLFPLLGVGSTSAFNPLSYSPPLGYDAAQQVYSDAGTTPAANAGSVQQWNNLGTASANLTQATGSLKPTYVTNLQNSLPGVLFETDDYMTLSSTNLGKSHTISFVINFKVLPSSATQVVLSNGSARFLFISTVFRYLGAGTTAVDVPYGALSADTTYLFTIVRSGTSVSFYKNTVQLGTTQTLNADNDFIATTMGCLTAGSQHLNARILNLYAYTQTDIRALHEAKMMSDFGLS